MLCRIILVVLSLLSPLVHLHGQADSLILDAVNNPALKEYNLRRMSADKAGRLWFATDKGILKYDGNELTLFEHSDTDSATLQVNSSGFLYFDKWDNLYVFEVGAIDYLHTKTGKVERLPVLVREGDKSKLAFPYAFSEPFIDSDESIWVGILNVGFLHFNRLSRQTEYFSIPKHFEFQNNTVFTIKPDLRDTNRLWLATDDGIYSFDKSTKHLGRNFRSSQPEDSSGLQLVIQTMDLSHPDTIWFTVPAQGVGCYSIQTGRYTIFPDADPRTNESINHDITVFTRRNDDEYFLAFGDKLPATFNIRTHRYAFNARSSQPLPAVQLRHILPDSSGNFWSLIYYQLYVAAQSRNKFSTISFPDDPVNNRIENVFKTVIWDEKRKQYYVAFDTRNCIFVLNEQMSLIKSLPIETDPSRNEYAEPSILDIALDDKGRLWVTGSSLWVSDGERPFVKANKYRSSIQIGDQRFQNIVPRGNTIYLQPSNPSYHSIYRINTDDLRLDSIPISPTIWNNAYKDPDFKYQDVLLLDKKGEKAYIGYGFDLYQIDLRSGDSKKMTTIRLKHFNHFHNQSWYRLDDNENLWVSSGEGMFIYDTHTFQLLKHTPRKKDTYDIQMYNVEGKGIMCVLWSEGITLIDYVRNKEYKYSLGDGLTTIFNSGVSCVNNMLFVGAIQYMHYRDLRNVIESNAGRKCYLSRVLLYNKNVSTDSLPEYLHDLRLAHDQNFLTFTFSSTAFEQAERLEYRYRLSGVDKEWIYVNYLNRTISYNGLAPGGYTFFASVKNPDGSWSNDGVALNIVIVPAWWQTGWFKLAVILASIAIIGTVLSWRIRSIRRQEQEKAAYEKELIELEAKALRSQMNPHFIFNSLNSIKSLINRNETELAAGYLTTFSKLIRTLFQNSDKREISLFEEIETCKLYTELEVMRFKDKVNFVFDIDDRVDMKDIKIPALILQPFIENAIWHGLVPKESGGRITVAVRTNGTGVECIIDDNGIGRELSAKNKAQHDSTHQSKGIGLTESRLELDKILNDREDTIFIIDKKSLDGKPEGTTVIITFKEKDT